MEILVFASGIFFGAWVMEQHIECLQKIEKYSSRELKDLIAATKVTPTRSPWHWVAKRFLILNIHFELSCRGEEL